MLIKILDISEVKEALFSIDASKTLGPDGFGVGFFKHYWELIKFDFYQCIFEFFINGKLLRQIDHTFLTLIPKRDNPYITINRSVYVILYIKQSPKSCQPPSTTVG